MKKWLILIVIFLLLIIAWPGCSSASVSLNPDIRGTVTEIAGAGENIVILIEGQIQEDTQYDKARITITGSTDVLIQQDGRISKGNLSSIQKGQVVQVVFDGPVMESYPVQSQAGEIVVIK